MKQIPILFSTPMVQAILDGRKTMTRRIVKHKISYEANKPGRTDLGAFGILDKHGNYIEREEGEPASLLDGFCPYGKPGDVLWVREKFIEGYEMDANDMYVVKDGDYVMKTWYAADRNIDKWFNADKDEFTENIPWKPSIHMPKSACRIWLEVVRVKVERLQEISRGDAMSEGCPYPNMMIGPNPINWFIELWQSINGNDSWELNPFVWVVEFRKIKKP